jgi:hypothetical protein
LLSLIKLLDFFFFGKKKGIAPNAPCIIGLYICIALNASNQNNMLKETSYYLGGIKLGFVL